MPADQHSAGAAGSFLRGDMAHYWHVEARISVSLDQLTKRGAAWLEVPDADGCWDLWSETNLSLDTLGDMVSMLVRYWAESTLGDQPPLPFTN